MPEFMTSPAWYVVIALSAPVLFLVLAVLAVIRGQKPSAGMGCLSGFACGVAGAVIAAVASHNPGQVGWVDSLAAATGGGTAGVIVAVLVFGLVRLAVARRAAGKESPERPSW